MSVMIYMIVTVEKGQVTPQVHVSSFQSAFMQSGGVLPDVPLEEVRFGVEITKEVLDFAGQIRREPLEEELT